MSKSQRGLRFALALVAVPFALTIALCWFVAPAPASAQIDPSTVGPPTVEPPPAPEPPGGAPDAPGGGEPDASIQIDLGLGDDEEGQPNRVVAIILLITIIAVAPSLLVMLTSFTRIVVVLALTRNALGLQGVPPNQVIVGLSLFLSLFVMFPTLSNINEHALQPLLKGDITQQEAYDIGIEPLKDFMLEQTRKDDLAMFQRWSDDPRPESPEDVSMAVLVPAFVLSELSTAFIIAFVIFVPFLIIDLIVSSSLMSMGMFMLPPVMISFPFKLLLFVMVGGWGLITESLIRSFQ